MTSPPTIPEYFPITQLEDVYRPLRHDLDPTLFELGRQERVLRIKQGEYSTLHVLASDEMLSDVEYEKKLDSAIQLAEQKLVLLRTLKLISYQRQTMPSQQSWLQRILSRFTPRDEK